MIKCIIDINTYDSPTFIDIVNQIDLQSNYKTGSQQ